MLDGYIENKRYSTILKFLQFSLGYFSIHYFFPISSFHNFVLFLSIFFPSALWRHTKNEFLLTSAKKKSSKLSKFTVSEFNKSFRRSSQIFSNRYITNLPDNLLIRTSFWIKFELYFDISYRTRPDAIHMKYLSLVEVELVFRCDFDWMSTVFRRVLKEKRIQTRIICVSCYHGELNTMFHGIIFSKKSDFSLTTYSSSSATENLAQVNNFFLSHPFTWTSNIQIASVSIELNH
jgi:hypothetical protein